MATTTTTKAAVQTTDEPAYVVSTVLADKPNYVETTLEEVYVTSQEPAKPTTSEVIVSPIYTDVPTTPVNVAEAATPSPASQSKTNKTSYYAGGAAAVGGLGAAAAALFYKRRAPAQNAIVGDVFSTNTNMNPMYEGNQEFENPLYNAENNVDDGFDNPAMLAPEA